MKPSEVMIGDYLLDRSGFPKKVDEVLDDGVLLGGVYHHMAEMKGIPITPEILEKNGMKPFDIDKLTDKGTAKWWHKSGDFFIKQYHFKHQNFKPTYSFGCHNHTLIEGIEYVHELQHALKLCKIEKEIQL